MTLLVLDVHLPTTLPSTASNHEIVPALAALVPKFWTYASSFATLGVFWIGHHNMYHAIVRSDRFLLWLNIVFFMVVCLVPFTTSVLSSYSEAQVATFIFGGNLAALGWLLWLQWVYAERREGMVGEGVSAAYRKGVRQRLLTYPVAATITMVYCFWSVPISLAIYTLLLPLCMISGHFDRD